MNNLLECAVGYQNSKTTSKTAVGYKLSGKKKYQRVQKKENSAVLQRKSLRKENKNKKADSCSPTPIEEEIFVKLRCRLHTD